jgi:hypothetical protein
VGAPQLPSGRLLPISHQQELARRRIAYALVGILGAEVLLSLLFLICFFHVTIESLRSIMTIIFGPTVALVGSATGFYFGTSRDSTPSTPSQPPT